MLPHMFSDGKVQLDRKSSPEWRKNFESDPAYPYEYRCRVEIVLAASFEAPLACLPRGETSSSRHNTAHAFQARTPKAKFLYTGPATVLH